MKASNVSKSGRCNGCMMRKTAILLLISLAAGVAASIALRAIFGSGVMTICALSAHGLGLAALAAGLLMEERSGDCKPARLLRIISVGLFAAAFAGCVLSAS